MSFSNRSLDSITEADLQELLNRPPIDLRKMDFRPALPHRSKADERELLYDIASFANAAGGDLICGIEKEGESLRLAGLQIDDIQAAQTRLALLIQGGIEPVVQGVKVRCVGLAGSQCAFVIRVPQSWTGPCWVKFGDSYRFFSRSAIGRYSLGYHDLRERFADSESRLERLRRFRLERLGRILAGETTVALKDAPKTVLHVLPLSAFAARTNISLPSIKRFNPSLRPFSSGNMGIMYNLDGIYTHDGLNNDGKTNGYFQIFRNGCIEVVGTNLTNIRDGQGYVPGVYFEEQVIRALTDGKKLYKFLSLELPFLLMLSLLGVKGYVMGTDYGPWGYYRKFIDRADLIVPEVVIEDVDFVPATVLHPVFDMVWNAAGFEQSHNYDEKGNWDRDR